MILISRKDAKIEAEENYLASLYLCLRLGDI